MYGFGPTPTLACCGLNEAKPQLVRSVSKNGDFDLASDYILGLQDNLTDSQVAELYEHIRDNSARLEEEWRDEFIEFFEGYESLIPEPLF